MYSRSFVRSLIRSRPKAGLHGRPSTGRVRYNQTHSTESKIWTFLLVDLFVDRTEQPGWATAGSRARIRACLVAKRDPTILQTCNCPSIFDPDYGDGARADFSGVPMMLSDGYTDVPDGKIASVVTLLEMTERVGPRPEPSLITSQLRRIQHPDVDWYRALHRRIGEEWLWFSRLEMVDENLAAIIHNPAVELHVVQTEGTDNGLLELNFRSAGECELAFFGLVGSLRGKGVGRWLMNRAIEHAWSHPIRRFWVHTCTLDHPDALAFYVRSGFRPFRRKLEIADDPRLVGTLPRTAAPQIPLITRNA
jgi:GNAT superfamily N-acetyltransferase